MNRLLVALLATASLGTLTACGASAPPGKELADELIDTLDVSDEVKACMHDTVTDFDVDPDAGFENFDDVAQKASEGQAKAIEIMDEFQNALAACN